MTADDAGVGVRERLAQMLTGLLWERGVVVSEWPDDEAEAYRADRWEQGAANARALMFQKAADALLADGFGDVAEAKAAALEEAAALNDAEAGTYELGENAEGWPVTSLNNASEKMRSRAIEYRTADTTGASELPPRGFAGVVERQSRDEASGVIVSHTYNAECEVCGWATEPEWKHGAIGIAQDQRDKHNREEHGAGA